MHYAIRMNKKKIKTAYAKIGKAKDLYKAVSQLYKSVMKSNRKKWVLAYLDEDKPTGAKRTAKQFDERTSVM